MPNSDGPAGLYPITDPRHPDYVPPATTPTPPTTSTPPPPTTTNTSTSTGTKTSTKTSTGTKTKTGTKTSTATSVKPPKYTPPKKPKPTNEVNYSQTAVAGMPQLGAAPDIPEPAQRTVHPQELVEFRMAQMMKQDNPYMAQAVTLAKQHANKSGLLNTTMAASAGVDAAIRNILPIAQQDAATLFTQGLENQKAVNEFLMQEYLTKTNFQLNEFGARVNTYNQALQQAHQKNESAILRWWEATQNNLNRQLDIWKVQFNAELEKELQRLDAELRKSLQASGESHSSGENTKACHRKAAADHAAMVQQIELEYGNGNRSPEWREHQLKIAEDNYRRVLASCG